jgi:hypothetical protein
MVKVVPVVGPMLVEDSCAAFSRRESRLSQVTTDRRPAITSRGKLLACSLTILLLEVLQENLDNTYRYFLVAEVYREAGF